MSDMIPRADILASFQKMYADKWGYIPGASGQKWTQADQDKLAQTHTGVAKYGQQWVGHRVADCSGAFVYVYRRHGLSLYHGSNRIAREYVPELLLPSCASPGMAAFKAYNPGDKYYSLPSEYRPGGKHYNGDLTDYYHIGLVDDDPRYVINAASTKSGVKRSKLTDGWCAVAYLSAVNYGGEPPMPAEEQMTVYAENGKPVNLRQGPGVTYPRIAEIPVGTEVTRTTVSGDWSFVHDTRHQGWMMSQFLRPCEEPAPGPEPEPTPQPDLALWIGEARALNEQLGGLLEKISEAILGEVG